MKNTKLIALVAGTLALAGCDEKIDKTVDRWFDSKDLSQLQAGIWIDPNGCDHWIIDDGVEGYADARRDKYGKHVCSNAAPPETATGPFKNGTFIFDPL